jgi:hypothetical protein
LAELFVQSGGKISRIFQFLPKYSPFEHIISQNANNKGAVFFYQRPYFMATLSGLSWKELVTLAGEQINAVFSFRPFLKGSRQMLWLINPWLKVFEKYFHCCWEIQLETYWMLLGSTYGWQNPLGNHFQEQETSKKPATTINLLCNYRLKFPI